MSGWRIGWLPHWNGVICRKGNCRPPTQSSFWAAGQRPKLPPRPISEINEAGERLVYAAQLYHAGKAPVIIVSGGFIEFFGSSCTRNGSHARTAGRTGRAA